jgi:hypothetical protein
MVGWCQEEQRWLRNEAAAAQGEEGTGGWPVIGSEPQVYCVSRRMLPYREGLLMLTGPTMGAVLEQELLELGAVVERHGWPIKCVWWGGFWFGAGGANTREYIALPLQNIHHSTHITSPRNEIRPSPLLFILTSYAANLVGHLAAHP